MERAGIPHGREPTNVVVNLLEISGAMEKWHWVYSNVVLEDNMRGSMMTFRNVQVR